MRFHTRRIDPPVLAMRYARYRLTMYRLANSGRDPSDDLVLAWHEVALLRREASKSDGRTYRPWQPTDIDPLAGDGRGERLQAAAGRRVLTGIVHDHDARVSVATHVTTTHRSRKGRTVPRVLARSRHNVTVGDATVPHPDLDDPAVVAVVPALAGSLLTTIGRDEASLVRAADAWLSRGRDGVPRGLRLTDRPWIAGRRGAMRSQVFGGPRDRGITTDRPDLSPEERADLWCRVHKAAAHLCACDVRPRASTCTLAHAYIDAATAPDVDYLARSWQCSPSMVRGAIARATWAMQGAARGVRYSTRAATTAGSSDTTIADLVPERRVVRPHARLADSLVLVPPDPEEGTPGIYGKRTEAPTVLYATGRRGDGLATVHTDGAVVELVGWRGAYRPVRCSACRGTGRYRAGDGRDVTRDGAPVPCAVCDGKGHLPRRGVSAYWLGRQLVTIAHGGERPTTTAARRKRAAATRARRAARKVAAERAEVTDAIRAVIAELRRSGDGWRRGEVSVTYDRGSYVLRDASGERRVRGPARAAQALADSLAGA